MSERYEFYDFGSTESEIEVSKILVNLPDLYLKSKSKDSSQLRSTPELVKDPPEPLWAVRKRRSVLNNPPSPPPRSRSPPVPERRIKKEKRSVQLKEKQSDGIENPRINVEAGSPSTPLGFSPATADKNSIKKKSSKKKKKSSKKKKVVRDWLEEINKLENLRDQLKLSSDKVKEFHSSILNYNLKLNARKIQIYGEIKKGGIDLNKKIEPQYQFPLFACQLQEPALQPTSLRYLNFFPTNPDPAAFPASSDGGMEILNQQNVEEMEPRRRFDMVDKSFRAADARKRRMVKINEKKNCGGGGDKKSN